LAFPPVCGAVAEKVDPTLRLLQYIQDDYTHTSFIEPTQIWKKKIGNL
jgi:hypothetical protein